MVGMDDDMDWRDGSIPRTLPEGIGLEWSRSRARGRRRQRRQVPWMLIVVVVVVALGCLLWYDNRAEVHLRLLSIHVTAPIWVVGLANLVLGLILGGALVARARR
jgi:uncharacterized integral membrane protein